MRVAIIRRDYGQAIEVLDEAGQVVAIVEVCPRVRQGVNLKVSAPDSYTINRIHKEIIHDRSYPKEPQA